MSLSGGTFSSGTSSGSSLGTLSCGSEGDMELQARMELKRKRRMESNRESARRSRLRKQQHLDDLTSQVNLTQKKAKSDEKGLELQDLLKPTPIMHGDLFSEVDQLKAKKQQLITALNVTANNYAAAEAQNSVLRARMMELQNRLCTLREIIYCMNLNQLTNAATVANTPSTVVSATANYDAFGASRWNSGMQMVQQPIDQLLYQCF